jgi:hypothetical protein
LCQQYRTPEKLFDFSKMHTTVALQLRDCELVVPHSGMLNVTITCNGVPVKSSNSIDGWIIQFTNAWWSSRSNQSEWGKEWILATK